MKTLVPPTLAALLCVACSPPGSTSWTVAAEQAPHEQATEPTPTAAPSPAPTDALSEPLEPPRPRTLLDELAVAHHDPKYHDHLEEAVMYGEEGRTGEAIDALRLALFDAPGSAVVWMSLGRAYDEVGRGERAEACVRQALTHDRRLVEGHRFLTRRLLDLGEAEAARPHAEALAGLAPDDADAAHLLGRTYVALSMWDEAIRQNRRAVAADPGNVHAYNNLGFAALQVGRAGLALQYLEAALELDGVRPYMLNNLGIAYERTGRPGDALAVYARAADMDPSYVKARANRDRVREVVDQQIADEVSRMLAEKARERRGDADGARAALVEPADPFETVD